MTFINYKSDNILPWVPFPGLCIPSALMPPNWDLQPSIWRPSCVSFLFLCVFTTHRLKSKFFIMVPSVLCDLAPAHLFYILSWHNPLLLCSSHPSGPRTGRAVFHGRVFTHADLSSAHPVVFLLPSFISQLKSHLHRETPPQPQPAYLQIALISSIKRTYFFPS